jgi:hypothetical protein
MSTIRVSREQAGNRVFEALCNGDWTITEGCEVTGLTRAQWHTGLAYIRDVLAGQHSEPVTYDAKTHRYALAEFEIEVEKYIATRIKTFAVQLARLRTGTFVPASVKFETDSIMNFRHVDDSLSRTFKDLGRVLEDIGEPMPPKLRVLMNGHAA